MSFEPATATAPGVIFTRGFDVIELLHSAPHAAERLRELRQRTSDAHALTIDFQTKHDVNTARGDCERRLQRLLAPRSQGGFDQSEDFLEVIELRQQLAKLTDEARRLAELDQVRTAVWTAASHTLQAVEGYLKDGRPHGTTLADYDGPEPTKLAKGETSLLDAIENRRRRVRELRADLHRVRSSPFPSSHAKKRMREMIEQLAQQGQPNCADLVEHDRPITWQTEMLRSEVRGGDHLGLGFAETVNSAALLAWLHKPALIAALDREIDAEADDAAALTHEARQKAEAELLGDMVSVERDEASLIWLAQEQQLPAEFRPDCSPIAILQARLVSQSNGGGR